MPSVTIIGVGRVGGALEIAFRETAYRVEILVGRSGRSHSNLDDLDHVSSEIIIISTPDGEIEKVAADLAAKISGTPIILHTSGALSSSVLAVLSDLGCSKGSMHPLVSISSPGIGAKRFGGAYFCVEGDERAVIAARAIVNHLGGHSFEIASADKALYHASAVAACGHVTALIDISVSMMVRAGVAPELSSKILNPLIRSTIDNIEEQGTMAALTGTFARADADGLRRQLNAFEGKLSEEELEIYLDLASRSLEIAIRQGVDPGKISAVARLISLAKSKLR